MGLRRRARCLEGLGTWAGWRLVREGGMRPFDARALECFAGRSAVGDACVGGTCLAFGFRLRLAGIVGFGLLLEVGLGQGGIALFKTRGGLCGDGLP